MTVITRQSAFIYAAGESIAEMAFPVVLTAVRWGVLAYDLVTSEEARQTYHWVKEMTIALGQLAFWSAVWCWAKVQRWVDTEVAAALPADHFVDANKMVEADPFSPAVNLAYATVPAAMPPVATLVVPVADALEGMTTAQLRKLAIAHNRGLAKDDPRRIANAARLTKAQALAVLG